MLRDLNINEMNAVSGGAEAGSGDEIIVTGTRIEDTGSGTGFSRNPEGLMITASGMAGDGINSMVASVGEQLNEQGFTQRCTLRQDIARDLNRIDRAKDSADFGAGQRAIAAAAILDEHFGCKN